MIEKMTRQRGPETGDATFDPSIQYLEELSRGDRHCCLGVEADSLGEYGPRDSQQAGRLEYPDTPF